MSSVYPLISKTWLLGCFASIPETCAVARFGGHGNACPRLFHDLVYRCQPQSCSFASCLGGKERFKDPGESRRCHTMPRVTNGEIGIAARQRMESRRQRL